MTTISAVSPLAELASGADTGFYRRSLRVDEDGEWDWDLDLKSNPAFIHRWGWGRAVLAGHARVAVGLHIDTPVLVLTSARSNFSRTWDESMHETDLVLDVERICAAATHLGPLVTIRRITGGVHDLVLSREPVRRQVFDEMARWIGAYVRPEGLTGQYHEALRRDAAGATTPTVQWDPEDETGVTQARRDAKPRNTAPEPGGADEQDDAAEPGTQADRSGWRAQRWGLRGSWLRRPRTGQAAAEPRNEPRGQGAGDARHTENRS